MVGSLAIPAAGAIEIDFPATFTLYDNFCINDPTSALKGNWQCIYSGAPNKYTITGMNTVPTGSTVVIDFWAAAPVGATTFTVKAYDDAAKNYMIFSNAITGPTVGSRTGFKA